MQTAPLRPSPQALYEPLQSGELVLLNITEGQYFTLNETGARVWNLVLDGLDTYGIARQLAEEHDVPVSDVLPSVTELIGELQEHGLLIQAPT